MADTLYRYDEPTQQWIKVTDLNRIEVKGTSGGGEWIDFLSINTELLPPPILTNIDIPE